MSRLRDYEARANCFEIWGARCRGLGRWWTAQEASYSNARRLRRHQQADQTAADTLKLCRPCPAKHRCLRWAISEHYTGFAGGTVIVDGEPARSTR